MLSESQKVRFATGGVLILACLALLGLALATTRGIVLPSIALTLAISTTILYVWKGYDAVIQSVALGCTALVIALSAHIFLGVQLWIGIPVAIATTAVAIYGWWYSRASDDVWLRLTGAALVVGVILWSASSALAPRNEVLSIPTETSGHVSVAISKHLSGGDTTLEASKGMRFDAYDAPEGTNNFGPTQQFVSTEVSFSRVQNKLENDPLYLATMKEFFLNGSNLSTTTAMKEARQMMSDAKYRQSTLDWVTGQVATVTSAYADVTYESLGMIPGADPSALPELTKFSEQVALGNMLVVVLNNGQVRLLRVSCDYQPAVQSFKKVRPGPAPVSHTPTGGGPSPSTSITTISTTSETPTTTPTTPTTTSETPTTTPTTPTTTSETPTTTPTTPTTTTVPPTTTVPTCPPGTTGTPPDCLEVKPSDPNEYPHITDAPQATVTGPAATLTVPDQPAGTTEPGVSIPDNGVDGPILAPDAGTTEPQATPAPIITQAPAETEAPNTDVDPDAGAAAPLPAPNTVDHSTATSDTPSSDEVPTVEADVSLQSTTSPLVPTAVTAAGLIGLFGVATSGLFGGRKKAKYTPKH